MLRPHVRSLCPSFLLSSGTTAAAEIYTLSLHDALPILASAAARSGVRCMPLLCARERLFAGQGLAWRRASPVLPAPMGKRLDRKSTRLNSSHLGISYAVFCLKKKNVVL